MAKILVIFIFVFITIAHSFAQDTLNHRKRLFYRGDRQNSLSTSFCSGIQKTIDEGVSPLLYRGTTLGAGIGYQSFRKNKIWNISGAFGTSKQFSPAINDIGYYQGYNIDINFKYLWNLDKQNKFPLRLYAGIGSNQTNRLRINEQMFNAAFNYDIMWGLGGSLHLSKTLKIKAFDINLWKWYAHYRPHKITFEYNIDFPIICMNLRPSYVVIENFVGNNNTLFGSNTVKFTSINEMLYIQSDLGLTYHLRTKNEIRFAYIWQYYNIQPEYSPVAGAMHLFQIIFRFKLNDFDNEAK